MEVLVSVDPTREFVVIRLRQEGRPDIGINLVPEQARGVAENITQAIAIIESA